MPTRTNVYANIVKTQPSPITSSRHGGFHAPKGNVWAELIADEAEELSDFLYIDPNPFNLTKNITASEWENTLRSIEILQPNKSDVVSYLDHSARSPSLWAHVVVVERAQQWA